MKKHLDKTLALILITACFLVCLAGGGALANLVTRACLYGWRLASHLLP